MADEVAPPEDGLGRLLHRLSSGFALTGGLVLVAMTLLVVTSVLGRAIFSFPVPGDFEIVGLGAGIAIFLFLPYCYVQRGNVAVDIFVKHTPAGIRRSLDSFAALIFALVAALFAWRMLFGLADTFYYEDISMIVGVPLWWAYPFAVASFGLLTVNALYTVFHPWEQDDE
jgi:TRAP-type C4-dicarboxylate transport system permease small subunit